MGLTGFINPAFNHLNALQRGIHGIAHRPYKKLGALNVRAAGYINIDGFAGGKHSPHRDSMSLQMWNQFGGVDHRLIDVPTGIKAQRNTRSRGGIGFAACECVKNGFAGIFGCPNCGQATRGVEFQRGLVGFTVWVVLSQAAQCGRLNRACRSTVVPLLNIPRVGVMAVSGRDKAIL